ncbi:hypothetical protein LNKW23_09830 [Paralimibaculum aggregatum]|uniref:Radical SAM core domain-containing protein n=1 Tax=Paralimibaculum aggregatum TaxID=3036245 RepID=A0ABQ6LHS2_9RHOB|nr:radical SAM protein [Limibaculum sp. NKW23]GMG81770.1 hypothetical protein LNKW23_09830 [Limibaculum sp. NKW23]
MPDTLPPPRFVFMEVNKRCNLRCTHCDYWQRDDDDRARYLGLDAKRAILDDFAAMNPDGALVICGGEPMLDLEEYFGLCAAARARGLHILSVVNGTRIRRAEMAERVLREGPHEVSISLNSHDPALHDETRGVPGAFERAVAALRLLVAAKRRLGMTDSRIYVMGLIFARNYEHIEEFYDLVLNDIGADQLKLNFLQPSFGGGGGAPDPFFAAESGVDAERLTAILSRADARFGLGLNPAWIDAVGMYFRSIAAAQDLERGWASRSATEDHICNTYERNVMIDHYGVARLCFSTQFPGKALRAPGDLRRFWERAGTTRARMRQCNQWCGISHSVRRESSTLKGRAKMEAHLARHGPMPAPDWASRAAAGLHALVR